MDTVKENNADAGGVEQAADDFELISESGEVMLFRREVLMCDVSGYAESMLAATLPLVDLIGEGGGWCPEILYGFSILTEMLTDACRNAVRVLEHERTKLGRENEALLQKLKQKQQQD